MKRNILIRILSIMVLLCLLPASSALAWKVSPDTTIKRGYIDDNGVMFKVPASFTLDTIEAKASEDILRFLGPTDTNGFTAEIAVTIRPDEMDLSGVTAIDVEQAIYDTLNGDNILCLVDKDIQTDAGVPARFFVFFYNAEVGSMGMVYRYDLNLGGCYVMIEYNAFAATRTLPDEVPQLPELLNSMSIGE